MIDFDKMFELFLRAKCASNKNLDYEELESLLPNFYDEWENQPQKELGGRSPRQAVEAMEDKELLQMLLPYNNTDRDPPYILTDEIAKRRSIEGGLLELLSDPKSSEPFRVLCGNLLEEMGSTAADNVYADAIFDDSLSDDFRAFAVEILLLRSQQTAPLLIERLSGATSEKTKQFVADAAYTYRHPKVLSLLVDLFFSADNVPLYAQYMTAHGDPKVIPILLEYAADCGYLEFMEVRNTVEALGGDFDIQRDFSADPFFIKLKSKA